ncbi:hypothetical protein [Anaeromyxobacter sp. SG64]|uniref:hypothetical protein n=1 Tax=Anaeromyxobacter sp. SG64 TaxID=2925409 RepID=UPI001F591BBA|nr:hypothetical protein [Anaeromyxobacter sp. SG64]
MRTIVLALGLVTLFTSAVPGRAAEPAARAADSTAARCEHGVKKTLCARCNPKLVPVFKAKGDWCGEHGVPESQCARCNPKLAKEGVK